MNPGDVVLIRLPQLGGALKLRPALVVAMLPGPFQNVLICGISTRVQNLEADWDELVEVTASDFPRSGLHRRCAIRLSYLHAAEAREICGVIGQIDPARLDRLKRRLIDLLSR